MDDHQVGERLTAEQRARVRIDAQLGAAGWLVQDRRALALGAGVGVAVREVVMAPGHGRVDDLLSVDRKVVGVIEAKPEGTALSGVEWQSAMYATGLPEDHRRRARVVEGRLPFVLEASGSETHLTNGLDPEPRARRFAGFPQPQTLARWLRDAEARPEAPTWRGRVRALPPVPDTGRPAQSTAMAGIEASLAGGRHERSLVQMATGAGKTFTAVSECYRLLKHGGMRRILFLVDRTNLGEQTKAEFETFVTPDDGRTFTELYPIFPDLLIRARVDRTRALPQYVVAVLQSLPARQRFRRLAEGLAGPCRRSTRRRSPVLPCPCRRCPSSGTS